MFGFLAVKISKNRFNNEFCRSMIDNQSLPVINTATLNALLKLPNNLFFKILIELYLSKDAESYSLFNHIWLLIILNVRHLSECVVTDKLMTAN